MLIFSVLLLHLSALAATAPLDPASRQQSLILKCSCVSLPSRRLPHLDLSLSAWPALTNTSSSVHSHLTGLLRFRSLSRHSQQGISGFGLSAVPATSSHRMARKRAKMAGTAVVRGKSQNQHPNTQTPKHPNIQTSTSRHSKLPASKASWLSAQPDNKQAARITKTSTFQGELARSPHAYSRPPSLAQASWRTRQGDGHEPV